jgi:ribonuclease D
MNQIQTAPEDVLYVADERTLTHLVSAVEPVSRVALDTEADSLHHYYEKVCLIQLNVDGQLFIVDPLCGLDLAPLIRLLEERTLLIHGADYDIRLLKKCCAMTVRHIFDTKIAVQLLGYRNISLAAQVMQHFGVHLSKAAQKMDWSRRPLSPKMLHYAGNDVRYLPVLVEILERELIQSGRFLWCAESCEALIAASLMPPDKDEERAWRVKGATALGRQGMAIVKELWYWREEEAKEVDLPTFRIMTNDELVMLAHWAMENRTAKLNDYASLPRGCQGERFRTLCRALERAIKLKSSQWPYFLKGEKKERYDRQLVELLKKRRDLIAEELELDPPLLASHRALTLIARALPSTKEEFHRACLLQHWQIDILSAPLMEEMEHYERNLT